MPQLHLPQSQPQIVFDTEPIADPVLSAPVRVSRSPEENEDPSIILARDGRFYVVSSSKQRGRVDLFISSSATAAPGPRSGASMMFPLRIIIRR